MSCARKRCSPKTVIWIADNAHVMHAKRKKILLTAGLPSHTKKRSARISSVFLFPFVPFSCGCKDFKSTQSHCVHLGNN